MAQDPNSWYMKQWADDASQQYGLLGLEGNPKNPEPNPAPQAPPPAKEEKKTKDKFKPAPKPPEAKGDLAWMKDGDPMMRAATGMDEEAWAKLNPEQVAQIQAAKEPPSVQQATAPESAPQPQSTELSPEQTAQIHAAARALPGEPQPQAPEVAQAPQPGSSPNPTPQSATQAAQIEGQNTPEPILVQDPTTFAQPDTSGLPETGLGLYGAETPSTNPVTSSGRVNSLFTGELADEIHPSRWEKFVTNLKLESENSPVGFMSGETGAWMRGMAQNEVEAQNAARGVFKISPEEANKRYPGMPVPFSEPVDPYVAQLQYDDFLHRTRLQAWAARGESSPIADFTAGVTGGFADPLNAALGIATGGLFKAFGLAEGFTAAGVRNVFLSNLGINTITGVPSYLQEKRERQDVTLMDEAHNAAMGALGGTGLHYLFHGLGYLLKKPAVPEDVIADNTKAKIAAEETRTKAEYAPNPADMGGHVADRFEVGVPGSRDMVRDYGAEQLPLNTHYVGIRSDGSFVMHDDHLGPGVQTSNDHGRVNAMASDGTGRGWVAKLKMPEDLKLLDLGQAADSAEAKPAVDEIRRELGIDKTKEIVEAHKGDASALEPKAGESIQNYLERLHSMVTDPQAWREALTALAETFRKEGYAGYGYEGQGDQRTHLFYADNLLEHQDGAKRLGPPELADNRIQPDAQLPVNEKAVPRLSEEAKAKMVEDSMKPENSQDADIDAEVRELKKGPSINSNPEDMDEPTQAMALQAKAVLDRLAKEDPELHAEVKEEMDRIKQEAATEKQAEQVLKDFIDCIGGSMA